ncbi:hypothetical protein GS429_06690 [Natronorubrum sp. JWXQ-INN-674]|uniref:Uncharacterized protein n=1 Tax=Natronorubrum halalkaliphilum TaxID=2691917 RepID=A0A6B0VKX2_9EURY|nr:hypothetical protein [Natronorubrum halalkaliphilum]MXV61757.1 hypothetical protein [Natronorubrum halalkaliphilum]
MTITGSLPTRATRTLRDEGAIEFVKTATEYGSYQVRRLGRYYGRSARARLEPARADPWRPITIDPHDVEWTLKAAPSHGAADVADFDHWWDAGRIVDGDWDRRPRVRFEEMPKYRAVRKHFLEGVPWEETAVFSDLQEAIAEHGSFDGCDDLEDLRERYRDIDRLYERIREEGYRSRRDLCGRCEISCRLDMPTVHIGRDGTLISAQGGGYHRLAIGRILDVPVEARVVVRHRKWQDVRETIARAESVEHAPQTVREYAAHPDLEDVRR